MHYCHHTDSITMCPVLLASLLLLLLAESSSGKDIQGVKNGDSCACDVDIAAWDFPVQKFDDVTGVVNTCGEMLQEMEEQVALTEEKLPQIEATIGNVTKRLAAFQYLNSRSLYHDLRLRQLDQDLSDLEQDVRRAHDSAQRTDTQKLLKEVQSVREKMPQIQSHNMFNLEAIRENMRRLRNRLETCRTIDSEFKSNCSQRLLTRITPPLVTKLSPYGKSYPSGAWGRETNTESPERYWIQPLVSGNRHGNVLRMYPTYDDFMASRNHEDISVAPSYTSSNAIQGPGTLLYGEALFFQCYNTGELCRFDLLTKATLRKALPGAGFNNKFPYCYYSCRDWTDIDMSADESGLWVIYATEANHGNVVLSHLDPLSLNVTHTWHTRLFKKSVSNTFMVCGVLYATRYVGPYLEEVFYAFDTATGQEDNSLAVKMEKVADGVASLHYNPVDKQLYLYNDSYLLAYKLNF